MKKENNDWLFNLIAPVYGWFYRKQKRKFLKIFLKTSNQVNLGNCKNVLDIGCGTGALCSVMADLGYIVTGVDSAANMLKVAKKKTKKQQINYFLGNASSGLEFENDSFDIVIASFVAHGLCLEDRLKLYQEMARLAKRIVIIHDYNNVRNLGITIIEKLEGGDYFRFIREAKLEMSNCLAKNKKKFNSDIRIINVDKYASWYLCEVEKIKNIPD
jgi:ubiquinone/menaquinone biosynthesis C-methylase UbiE